RRDAEIGDRDTTRFHRSIEWRAHFQFAECWSVPDALGLQIYHDVDLESNSRTTPVLASIFHQKSLSPRARASRLLRPRPHSPASCPSITGQDRHGTLSAANRGSHATPRNIFATPLPRPRPAECTS